MRYGVYQIQIDELSPANVRDAYFEAMINQPFWLTDRRDMLS